MEDLIRRLDEMVEFFGSGHCYPSHGERVRWLTALEQLRAEHEPEPVQMRDTTAIVDDMLGVSAVQADDAQTSQLATHAAVANDEREEPWACTCGGVVTEYGEGHNGNCAVMQWHDLQVVLRLRADLKRLREALREHNIISVHDDKGRTTGSICEVCAWEWPKGYPEDHAPDCLAAQVNDGLRESSFPTKPQS